MDTYSKTDETQKHHTEQGSQIQTDKQTPHDPIYLKIGQNESVVIEIRSVAAWDVVKRDLLQRLRSKLI